MSFSPTKLSPIREEEPAAIRLASPRLQEEVHYATLAKAGMDLEKSLARTRRVSSNSTIFAPEAFKVNIEAHPFTRSGSVSPTKGK